MGILNLKQNLLILNTVPYELLLCPYSKTNSLVVFKQLNCTCHDLNAWKMRANKKY